MYDPVAAGAECHRCPLRENDSWHPVPDEIRADARLFAIGEAPGKEEERRDAPFVGASGLELQRALHQVGLRREDVSLGNVLACRPPGKTLNQYMRRLARRNRKRVKEGLEPWPSPMACCTPRLLREVVRSRALLILGATAWNAVSPYVVRAEGTKASRGEEGLGRDRGFPLTVRVGEKVIPALATFHPAYVLRSKRYIETFRSDVAKAVRVADGRLTWQGPQVVFDPSLVELDAVLERLAEFDGAVAVDTETDGIEPETVNLRCVGIGSPDLGVCIGFRSVEPCGRVWRCPPDLARARVCRFLADPRVRLAVHNRAYDERILERHGMPLPHRSKCIETLLLHHVIESELPHDLDFLSSRYTDAAKHKAVDHEAWSSDRELHEYCITDCAVTAALVPRFVEQLKTQGLVQVYKSDVELQRNCIGMHRAGLRIDEAERRRHAARLWKRMAEHKVTAEAAAGIGINLNSPDQVRDLLYDRWAMPWPSVETDGGDPSTNKDSLYELLLRDLPEHARAFIEALQDYRMAGRALRKDVLRAGEVPTWLAGWDDEDERESGLKVWPDGRVHPFWSAHAAVTGRPQSSDPNVSNVPATRQDRDSLRSMYVAEEGHVLVACDLDQAELRVVALLAGDDLWLRLLNDPSGPDIHAVNARDLFGIETSGKKDPRRTCAKNLTYASLYYAQLPTIQAQMRRLLDGDGHRPFSTFTLAEAKALRSRLLQAHPSLERWWARVLAEFRVHRKVADIVLGRPRRFLDARTDEDSERALSDLVNHPVQGAVGSIMGGTGACAVVMRDVGWPWDPESTGRGLGGPGIIHHNYDSLVVEVEASRGLEAKAALERAMNTTLEYEGRTVRMPAEAKIGRKWSEV